jgi:hypothetical protein
MPLCGLADAFLASSSIIFLPLSTSQLTDFHVFLLVVLVIFEQRSWCGSHAVGGEVGSMATYPSLVHAVTVQHSISVLSFRLDGYLLGPCHPNQIQRICHCFRIFRLISSSTPNQLSPSLILLAIFLAFPLIFA